jgi:hypothetical protein
MSATPQRSRAELRAWLLDARVDAAALRSDPGGRGWLPPPLRALVAEDPEAAADVAAFVALELELFGGAQVASDPWFTHRVVQALPPAAALAEVGPPRLGTAPRVAVWVTFHGIAAVLAYVWWGATLHAGAGQWLGGGATALLRVTTGEVALLGAPLANVGGAWLLAGLVVAFASIALTAPARGERDQPRGA